MLRNDCLLQGVDRPAVFRPGLRRPGQEVPPPAAPGGEAPLPASARWQVAWELAAFDTRGTLSGWPLARSHVPRSWMPAHGGRCAQTFQGLRRDCLASFLARGVATNRRWLRICSWPLDHAPPPAALPVTPHWSQRGPSPLELVQAAGFHRGRCAAGGLWRVPQRQRQKN